MINIKEYTLIGNKEYPTLQSRWVRYGLALALTGIILALKAQLSPLIGQSPLLLLTISVILSAWFGGLGPGILATLIGLLGASLIFKWDGSHTPSTSLQWIQISVFILQGGIVSFLSELSKQRAAAMARNATIYEQLVKTQSDLGEGVIFIENDKVAYINQAITRISGFTLEEISTLDAIVDRIVPEEQPTIRDRLIKRMAGHPIGDRYETAIYDTWGRRVEVEIAIKMLKFKKNVNLIILVHDITERKLFEEALRRSEEHYRLLVENVKDYAIFTLKKNGDIASWNEGAERILGYEESEVLGTHFSLLFNAEDKLLAVPYNELKIAEEKGRAILEGWRIRKDGSLIYASGVVTPLWNEAGKLRGFIKVLQDITEQKKSEEKIKHQAMHDALTDLPNRTLFMDRVAQAIVSAERSKTKAAVLFMDLDKFKNINDTLGHGVGDTLLQGVAQRLTESVRKEDTIARLGGDEFTILLPHIKTAEDCVKATKKIFKALKPAFQINGRELHISTSIGIAIYPQDGIDVQTLLKNADTALYGAKGQGRDTYHLYAPTLNSNASEILALENDLRQAVVKNELVLYYQPILEAATKRITGVEALVRWKHPRLGLLSPNEFIPIAEENGMIVDLNDWVLRTACNQSKIWQDKGLPKLCMSVNLSAREFSQKNLVEKVTKILDTTSLEPSCLELEVTESFAMNNINITVQRLKELKKMGVRVAIDDFGTGHSSLNYLKHLPISSLKIDRSFVKNCVKDKHDAEIIRAIITIAHSLDLSVIAEGVETTDQLVYLNSLSCDKLQGFLFSQPVAPEYIEVLLNNQQANEQ